MELMPVDERRAIRDDYQAHWYHLAAELAAEAGCKTALDVGAGHGVGMDILRESGLAVAGIDPLPLRHDILERPVSEVVSDGYDLVTACDVIEHVEEDVAFLRDLLRVARVGVLLSTPNYLISQCRNQHHVREYEPGELVALLHGVGVFDWLAWTSGMEYRAVPIDALCEAINNFGVWIPRGAGPGKAGR